MYQGNRLSTVKNKNFNNLLVAENEKKKKKLLHNLNVTLGRKEKYFERREHYTKKREMEVAVQQPCNDILEKGSTYMIQIANTLF